MTLFFGFVLLWVFVASGYRYEMAEGAFDSAETPIQGEP